MPRKAARIAAARASAETVTPAARAPLSTKDLKASTASQSTSEKRVLRSAAKVLLGAKDSNASAPPPPTVENRVLRSAAKVPLSTQDVNALAPSPSKVDKRVLRSAAKAPPGAQDVNASPPSPSKVEKRVLRSAAKAQDANASPPSPSRIGKRILRSAAKAPLGAQDVNASPPSPSKAEKRLLRSAAKAPLGAQDANASPPSPSTVEKQVVRSAAIKDEAAERGGSRTLKKKSKAKPKQEALSQAVPQEEKKPVASAKLIVKLPPKTAPLKPVAPEQRHTAETVPAIAPQRLRSETAAAKERTVGNKLRGKSAKSSSSPVTALEADEAPEARALTSANTPRDPRMVLSPAYARELVAERTILAVSTVHESPCQLHGREGKKYQVNLRRSLLTKARLRPRYHYLESLDGARTYADLCETVLRIHGRRSSPSPNLAALAAIAGTSMDDAMAQFDELGAQIDASHLCGEPKCATPGHVVLERTDLNTNRDRCHGPERARLCTHFPRCLTRRFAKSAATEETHGSLLLERSTDEAEPPAVSVPQVPAAAEARLAAELGSESIAMKMLLPLARGVVTDVTTRAIPAGLLTLAQGALPDAELPPTVDAGTFGILSQIYDAMAELRAIRLEGPARHEDGEIRDASAAEGKEASDQPFGDHPSNWNRWTSWMSSVVVR